MLKIIYLCLFPVMTYTRDEQRMKFLLNYILAIALCSLNVTLSQGQHTRVYAL